MPPLMEGPVQSRASSRNFINYTSFELELPRLLAAELPCNCTTHLCPPRSIMEQKPKKNLFQTSESTACKKNKPDMHWTCQASANTSNNLVIPHFKITFFFSPHLVIPYVRACEVLSHTKHVSTLFSSVQRRQVKLYHSTFPCGSLEECTKYVAHYAACMSIY